MVRRASSSPAQQWGSQSRAVRSLAMPPAAAALEKLLFFPSVCSFARSQRSVYRTACLGQPSQASVPSAAFGSLSPKHQGVRGFCLFFFLFSIEFYILPEITQPAKLLSLWAQRKGAGIKLVLAAAWLSHPMAGFEMPTLCPSSSHVNRSCGSSVRASGTGL